MTKNSKPHNDKQREEIRKKIEQPSKSLLGFFGFKVILIPFNWVYNLLVAFGDSIINTANFLWLGIINFPNMIKDIWSSFGHKKTDKKPLDKHPQHTAEIKALKPIVKAKSEVKTKEKHSIFGSWFGLKKVKTKNEIQLAPVTNLAKITPTVAKTEIKTKPNFQKNDLKVDPDLTSGSSMEILQNLAQVVSTLAENDRTYRQNLQKKVKLGQYLIFAAILILVINTVFILFQSPFQNANAGNNVVQTTSGVQNLITDTSQPGVRVVENFLTTKLIAEVGQSIDIQKDKIITKGTNNCKTPVSPPAENGCEFVLLPSSLSIPIRGTLYKSIKFEATITGDSEIVIIKKNYEKGRIIDNIGSVNATNLNKKMVLPESITGVEGLGIKLWEKGGTIEIRKIIIEYFNVESMIAVSGKINDWKEASPVLGSIYLDVNENKKFDIKTDKPWICKPNFPGLVAVNIDIDGSFVMYRDDSCFVDVKPDFFFTDEQKSVLPPGNWLMVLKDGKEVYNFTIEVKDKEKVLEFQSLE